MVLHRRQLPVIGPCNQAPELRDGGHGRAHCDHCDKPVHLLSTMREREIRSLLAAHAGAAICVQYLARRDGTLVSRPAPAAGLLAPALAGLAACAPHLEADELAWPDATASNVDGPVIPEVATGADQAGQTEDRQPSRPERGSPLEPTINGPTATRATEARPRSVSSREPDPAASEDAGLVRVDFVVDASSSELVRGMLVVDDPWHRPDRPDRLVYTPTRTLWRDAIHRWRSAWAARRTQRAGR